jgi:hypothetical protein
MTLRNLSDRDLEFEDSPVVSDAASTVVSLDAHRRKSASTAVVGLGAHSGSPAWEKEIVAALCRFLELPKGWDSYGGKPLRHDTGMFALQVLSDVMSESVPSPFVVPVSTGGVQFEWHQNDLDIELYIAAPYDSELTVHDLTSGEREVIPLIADFAPLSHHVQRLIDFKRRLPRAHVG